MTAKQLLHERIEELTEDDAAAWLDLFEDSQPVEPLQLTDEQRANMEQGMADLRAGRKVTHEEALRRLGISQRQS